MQMIKRRQRYYANYRTELAKVLADWETREDVMIPGADGAPVSLRLFLLRTARKCLWIARLGTFFPLRVLGINIPTVAFGLDFMRTFIRRDAQQQCYSVRDIRVACMPGEEQSAMRSTECVDILSAYTTENQFTAWFGEGPYEFDGVQLAAGDVVIDCGANIGFFSALASVRQCTAYAFEPMEHIRVYLNQTAQWMRNIHVAPYAVSDREQTLRFFADTGASGGSHQSSDESAALVDVHAIDLDTFVARNGIARVDFIKADIEGAERDMLRGATRILREFAPKLAICTYHLPDDPQVLAEIITTANPRYKIIQKDKKLYAYVP